VGNRGCNMKKLSWLKSILCLSTLIVIPTLSQTSLVQAQDGLDSGEIDIEALRAEFEKAKIELEQAKSSASKTVSETARVVPSQVEVQLVSQTKPTNTTVANTVVKTEVEYDLRMKEYADREAALLKSLDEADALADSRSKASRRVESPVAVIGPAKVEEKVTAIVAPKESKKADKVEEKAVSAATIKVPITKEDKTSATELALKQEIAALKSQLASQETSTVASQKSISSLRAEADSSKKRAQDLLKELDETRNRLMLAERQVERLSEHVQRLNACELGAAPSNQGQRSNSAAVNPATRFNPQGQRVVQAEPKVVGDLPVAVVQVDKGLLRAGPSKNDSTIASVAKGTRLTVQSKSKDGLWYLVYAPNGSSAWISSDIISFLPTGPGAGNLPNIRIRPVDPNF